MNNETDKIKEAYERACIKGLFISDSYSYPNPTQKDGYERVHSVVFLAYDGYHLGQFFNTKKEADKVAAELNALHSVEAVDQYFEKLRKDLTPSP